jgi:hypothetical protein
MGCLSKRYVKLPLSKDVDFYRVSNPLNKRNLLETYERRAIYDVPVHMCRAPMVLDYIRDMLDGCESWVLSGELEKLVIVILDENGRPLDSLVIEVSWYSDELNAIFTKDNLPLVKMEEEFRSMLVKLTATPISRPPPGTTTPGTFRILAHTLEESSNFETKVDQTEPANSWVLADPTWQEQQKNPSKQLELHPIKSTNSEELPFKMQFYLESRLP